MFYPVDSLKRGGRFYLCWVADSWPLRFATITHRQLWSQDIRKICDDLLEVMTNESGRPTNRFSLRLSSQLLRGLVRLYQRKATVFLGELCMINANVMKHSNKKWNIHDVEIEEVAVRRPQIQQLEIQEIVEEPPENEQRIVEMIQQSGNLVSNIADITLKETTITEVLLPPNDGFGEENQDQALQFLQDRTLEQMLVQPDQSTVHSGLEALALDITDKSHDKTRFLQVPAQMERISDHDVTLFKKSTGGELMPEFEKDIPEIPEIPLPELPVPKPDKPQEEPVVEAPCHVVETEPAKAQETVEIELEELEQGAQQAKRRKLRNKLIVDKKIKISTNQFRARIENPLVELRCQDSSDDIIFIRVPPETYFRRPCHGGEKIVSHLGFPIWHLFTRNLGVISVQPLAEREEQSAEAVRRKSPRALPQPILENIQEEQEAPIVTERPEVQTEPVPEANVTVNEMLNVSEPPRVSVPMDLDIADMLTQKVETLSQVRKRTGLPETVVESPKRQRSIGYVSFRESQIAKEQSQPVPPVPVFVTDEDADKENVPANLQQPQDAELILSSKLQEAGLADIIQPVVPEVEAHSQTQRPLTTFRKTGSDRSETPLGSLDRTKVSLGDSEQTTDSKRFIRDQWGTEGTMIKILKHIKAGLQPVTVASLLDKGPVISGYRRIIAARCFTSILKLKQHGFINVKKNADTLEIADVTLGPKLTSLNDL